MDDSAVLNLTGISKTFAPSTTPILNEVSLAVEKGESVAIMGASGSGKSSLLNIVSGLVQPDAGRITFSGEDLTALPTSQRDRFRAVKLGMVFQQFNLIDCLNVSDNISLPARYLGLPYREQLQALLKQLNLTHRATAQVSKLSGGEQQRVAIARALIHQPDMILADEPTGNLDTQTSADVTDILYGLVAQTQTAMVVVTHSDDVAARAHRQLHLKQGILI